MVQMKSSVSIIMTFTSTPQHVIPISPSNVLPHVTIILNRKLWYLLTTLNTFMQLLAFAKLWTKNGMMWMITFLTWFLWKPCYPLLCSTYMITWLFLLLPILLFATCLVVLVATASLMLVMTLISHYLEPHINLLKCIVTHVDNGSCIQQLWQILITKFISMCDDTKK